MMPKLKEDDDLKEILNSLVNPKGSNVFDILLNFYVSF